MLDQIEPDARAHVTADAEKSQNTKSKTKRSKAPEEETAQPKAWSRKRWLAKSMVVGEVSDGTMDPGEELTGSLKPLRIRAGEKVCKKLARAGR